MSRKTYLNFDLFVEPTPDGYCARVDSPAGQARVNFSLSLLKQELEERNKNGLEAVGSYLYDQIFQKELHTCLHNSLRQAERQKKGLRIRLRLDSAEVAALPWEYLYDNTNGRFFCLSSQTPLVRYIELPQREKSLLVEPPLKVLVMISTPLDQPPLDVEQELDGLLKAVNQLEQEGLLKLKLVTNATIKALQDELQDNEQHIFHFIGHGIFDQRTQQGMIIFENERRKSEAISAQRLGVLLYDSEIRLVLLNNCQGGRTSQSHLFAGVAQNLVQQTIPAVIAMQFNIRDPAAITFADEFYKAIGKKFPIDAALAEARKALLLQGIGGVEWGTPVLYMRAPDGRLFDLEQKPTIQPPLPSEKVDSANNRPEQKTQIEVRAEGQTEKLLHEKAQESISDGIEPHAELRLPFANREDELKFICGPKSPQHIQIYAPSGYGKTELLQKVKEYYEQKGWQVVWVDFSSPKHTGCAENKLALVAEVARQSGLQRLTSQTPTDAVREVARHWMRKRKQTLLLFDSLENVTDLQMLAWMKKEFFRPLAQKYIPVPKIRPKVVAAGRIREGDLKPHFHLHQLTAFDDPTIIDQLLRDLVQDLEMPSEWFNGMSKEIMQLTKGHPKCIANLLSFLVQEDFAVTVEYFIEQREYLFHNFLKKLIENEILSAFKKDESLIKILPTLSVLRGINLDVIHYLNEQSLITQILPTSDWHEGLRAMLNKFGLLSSATTGNTGNTGNTSWFQWEETVQQLLALQLELRDEKKYWQVHTVAARMYDEWVKGQDANGMQVHVIRQELSYHQQLLAKRVVDQISPKFIGRQEELELIDQLVNELGTLRIVCIHGPGGIGKTRLLQEVRRNYMDHKDVLVTVDIMNFDNPALHIAQNATRWVAKQLGEDKFSDFLREADDLRQMEITDERLAEKLSMVMDTYLTCYNRIAKKKRIILLIDNIEAIHNLDVLKVMLETAKSYKNTLLLYSGRRGEELYHNLRDNGLDAQICRLCVLKPFSAEQASTYFEQTEIGQEIDEETRKKICLLTNGHPVMINLALEWLEQEMSMPELPKMSEATLQLFANPRWRKLQEEFEAGLVWQIEELGDETKQIILNMAHVYHYFNADILSYLTTLSAQESQTALANLGQLTFVKLKPEGEYALHDQIRQLVNYHLWPSMDPSGRNRVNIDQAMMKYYGERVSELEAQLKTIRQKVTEARTVDQMWLWQSELLFHTLRVNLKQGYQLFVDLFDGVSTESRFVLAELILSQITAEEFKDKFTGLEKYGIEIRRVRYLLAYRRTAQAQKILHNLMADYADKGERELDMLTRFSQCARLSGNLQQALEYMKRAVVICDTRPELMVQRGGGILKSAVTLASHLLDKLMNPTG